MVNLLQKPLYVNKNNVNFQNCSSNATPFNLNLQKFRYYSTTIRRAVQGNKPSLNLNSYIIDNPFDNRKSIADYAKNKKGVYIF
jgi:hypothetical protein